MLARTSLIAAAAAAALALGACGGSDDESSSASSATAATTSTSSSAAGEMTAGEWMAASIPDESKAVQELVAEHPDECGDVDPKPGGNFQQAFAIDAAQAAPDTPLSEIIVQSCAEAGQGTS